MKSYLPGRKIDLSWMAPFFSPVGKDNPFFPVGDIHLNRLGGYFQIQTETILNHFVLGIDFHHRDPITEHFMFPV